jgi:hypothetical protein
MAQTSLGIVYPDGPDLHPSEEWWEQMALTTNQAILNATLPMQGINANQDLNVLTEPGIYRLSGSNAATVLNMPPGKTGATGFVTVTNARVAGNTWASQEIAIYGAAPERWWRVSKTLDGQWNPWQRMDPAGAALGTNTLTGAEQLDAFALEPGVYAVRSVTAAVATANLPAQLPGVLTVLGDRLGGSAVKTLFYAVYGKQPQLWWTVSDSLTTVNPWKRIDDSNGGQAVAAADLGTRHVAARERFALRRGGVIGTAGKPVVALRWDHGLVNFRDKVLPHIKRLGLPGSMAMNSAASRWNLPESAGVTPADLDAWAVANGLEVWNHGATHTDATTPDELNAEIVDALAALQAQVPSVAVEGWVIPGVGGTGYDGFSAGEEPTNWDTTAGRLILGYHAVSTSHMGAGAFPITGQRSIIPRHYSLDSGTAADTIAMLDALPPGSGTVLFLHPSQLDLADRITAAQYVQILEHVAALRDAGTIEVLTMGGLALADAAVTLRRGWFPTPTGSAAAPWSRSVPANVWQAQRGGTRALMGRARATGASATATLTASSGTALNASRAIALTSAWQQVVLPFTIPAGLSASASIALGVTGSGVEVTDMQCVAV